MYDDDSWITGDYARVANTTQNLWTQKLFGFFCSFLPCQIINSGKFVTSESIWLCWLFCHKHHADPTSVQRGLRSGVQPSYSIPPLRNSESSLCRDYLLVFPVTAKPLHTSHITSTKCDYSISAPIRIVFPISSSQFIL